MMLWLLVGAVALAAMLPLAIAVLRPARAHGRAEADLALYRAQLAELDREHEACLLYTSPSPRDGLLSRMPSSA